MSEVLGQGQDYARLLRAARARRMHHGMLIVGPTGSGKSVIGSQISRALLCRGDDPEQPCGRCSDCAYGDSHPDLHQVTVPEDKNGKKFEIPVDSVRELRGRLEHRPVEGGARVVVFDPADRLNVEGQNALLKTLEEPGRQTYILLLTCRPEGLLETVRSRVAELRVLPSALLSPTLVPSSEAVTHGLGDAHRQSATA